MNKFQRLYKKYIQNIYIRPYAKISNSKFSYRTTISSYCKISNSEIGRFTSIGRNTTVANSEIGSFCSISWNVTIGATQHDMTLPSTHAFHYINGFGFSNHSKRKLIKTKIGNDVWIGSNVVIMPGVIVGNGAVIGAGTIVTRDIEPYEVHVGNPNKLIRKRFSQIKIQELLELKWWNWDKEKIKKNIDFFKKPF